MLHQKSAMDRDEIANLKKQNEELKTQVAELMKDNEAACYKANRARIENIGLNRQLKMKSYALEQEIKALKASIAVSNLRSLSS